MLVAAKRNALEQIKRDIEAYVGKPVRLRANRGRRKVIEAEGVIEKTYPKVFVIKLDKNSAIKRMSYTYADVLTETVELVIDDNRVGVVNL